MYDFIDIVIVVGLRFQSNITACLGQCKSCLPCGQRLNWIGMGVHTYTHTCVKFTQHL